MKFEILHDTMNIAVNYTTKCFYIILIFLNRSIRTKPSIISRFHPISLLKFKTILAAQWYQKRTKEKLRCSVVGDVYYKVMYLHGYYSRYDVGCYCYAYGNYYRKVSQPFLGTYFPLDYIRSSSCISILEHKSIFFMLYLE